MDASEALTAFFGAVALIQAPGSRARPGKCVTTIPGTISPKETNKCSNHFAEGASSCPPGTFTVPV